MRDRAGRGQPLRGSVSRPRVSPEGAWGLQAPLARRGLWESAQQHGQRWLFPRGRGPTCAQLLDPLPLSELQCPGKRVTLCVGTGAEADLREVRLTVPSLSLAAPTCFPGRDAEAPGAPVPSPLLEAAGAPVPTRACRLPPAGHRLLPEPDCEGPHLPAHTGPNAHTQHPSPPRTSHTHRACHSRPGKPSAPQPGAQPQR